MAKKKVSTRRAASDYQELPYINVAQVGGIETSVVDDGAGKGVRVAWVNTGTGLRYKVTIDRGLDIAEAFYNAHSLTWLSYGGVTAPQRAYDKGDEWLRSYYAGLLTSCGPTNVGAPCTDAGQELGCHGLHSNTPASIESIVQPDPHRGKLDYSITGIVKTAKVFGENIELRRTIGGTLGEPVIRVRDEFINRGDTPSPHQWLLHINFGWPLLDKGARFVYAGKVIPRADSKKWFGDPAKYKKCPGPVKDHRGRDESVAYIEPKTDRKGAAAIALANLKLPLAAVVRFNKNQFPRWLNWQHFSPSGMFVTGLEPTNGGCEGRDVDRQRGWLDELAPGETRLYETEIEVLSTKKAINDFIKAYDG